MIALVMLAIASCGRKHGATSSATRLIARASRCLHHQVSLKLNNHLATIKIIADHMILYDILDL